MAEGPLAGLGTDERVLMRLKPAWRSFCDHFLVAAALAAVAFKDAWWPEVGRPFPLPPLLTLLLAAAVIIYIILKQRTSDYVVTNRRLCRVSLGLRKDLELARIDELKVTQPTTQRLLGCGKLIAADSQDYASRMRFLGIENPDQVKEAVARLIEEAKR